MDLICSVSYKLDEETQDYDEGRKEEKDEDRRGMVFGDSVWRENKLNFTSISIFLFYSFIYVFSSINV